MCMTDRAGCQSLAVEGGVLSLDVQSGELLQRLCPKMRRDLILAKLSVPLSGPGRDVSGRFPLVDATADEIGD
jgi:hypothetical protein